MCGKKMSRLLLDNVEFKITLQKQIFVILFYIGK